MAKNTGKDYERITKEIFSAILAQDAVTTTRIEHDVIEQGRDAKHQIDVLWEFEAAGVKYKTLVQAKDWNQAVDIGKLLQFKGVLNDISGQPRGVFVTKTGYQSGAKDFAEKNGIKLYELREPTEEDWQGKIKTIVMRGHIRMPSCTDIRLTFDQAWIRSQLTAAGLQSMDIQIEGMENEILVKDVAGNAIGTIRDFTSGLIPHDVDELEPEDRTHAFSEDVFLDTGDPRVPRVKLTHLTTRIGVKTSIMESKYDVGSLVKFILKDVLEDKSKLIGHDHRPVSKS